MKVAFAYTHASYDREYVQRFWRILLQVDRVLHEFRTSFIGKCSPVHFFWGSFDLAVTRFSGRRAPLHPGGMPHLPDRVTQEAYSHEVSSAGFWPGTKDLLEEPAFYSYAYPEPPGFSSGAVRPAQAYYHETLSEYVLPYATVRTAEDPDRVLMGFLISTYEAAASNGYWDRAALETVKTASDLTGLLGYGRCLRVGVEDASSRNKGDLKETARVEAFSDGVFAIAITLLIL